MNTYHNNDLNAVKVIGGICGFVFAAVFIWAIVGLGGVAIGSGDQWTRSVIDARVWIHTTFGV